MKNSEIIALCEKYEINHVGLTSQQAMHLLHKAGAFTQQELPFKTFIKVKKHGHRSNKFKRG